MVVLFNKKIICKNLTGKKFQGRDYVRELVRIRDKHRCKKCKKKWVTGTRRFDIHHLNGVCGKKSHKYDHKQNMDSLITLCHKCHLGLPENREKMRISVRRPYMVSQYRFILQARKTGRTYRDIAKEVGCTYQNIFAICKRYQQVSP